MFIFGSEEPNDFFLPGDINEFIWGTLAFLVVLAAFMWKGLPLLKAAMAGRTERIATELSDAEKTREDAERSLAAKKSDLGNADAESKQIVSEARDRAGRLKVDLMARADTDVAESRDRAAAEIEATKGQALADLRAEVATRAKIAATAVVEANLDDSTRNDLVESYINDVGGAR